MYILIGLVAAIVCVHNRPPSNHPLVLGLVVLVVVENTVTLHYATRIILQTTPIDHAAFMYNPNVVSSQQRSPRFH